MPRLWLDLTGIAPGSDAAVLVQRVAPVWRERLGDGLVLCRRGPGVSVLGWQSLASLTPQPSPAPHVAAWQRGLRDRMALWPPRTRARLRRAVALQQQVLGALRPTRLPPPAAPSADAALPEACDTWLSLLPFGDLTRFHAMGARLVLLAADRRPAVRPDWLAPAEAASLALWRETTEHRLALRLDLPPHAARGALVPPGPGRPVPASAFILADGEIGVPGKTPELLLAWRLLCEGGAALPTLVLAGPLGGLAADVLTQLRNSDGFAHSVLCLPDPTEAERAAWRRHCTFSLALEPHSAWGRAARDSLAAGVPCLSAVAVPGAIPVDPDNVTALARHMRAWIDQPPPRPAPDTDGCDWTQVADRLLSAIAP